MAPNRKPPKKVKSTNGCFVITILLTIVVLASLAATFYLLFLRPGPTKVPPPPTTQTSTAPAPVAVPSSPAPPPTTTTETTSTTTTAPTPTTEATLPPTPPGSAATGPRLAIIIDDIGNTKKTAEEIMALDLPLTFSILPQTPHALHLASLAKARGHHILLHLPMEPLDPKWSAGPGALLVAMSKAEILSTLEQDLATPYRPSGINNHMGSKFSEDPIAMRILLTAIKAKGLFFIDSQTSTKSVGASLARDLGVKTAKRDIFLDNEQQATKVLAQIGKAIALAHSQGSAIAIGHPYPATLEALRTAVPRLQREVKVVPAQDLVQ